MSSRRSRPTRSRGSPASWTSSPPATASSSAPRSRSQAGHPPGCSRSTVSCHPSAVSATSRCRRGTAIGLKAALALTFCLSFTYLFLRRLGVSVVEATLGAVAYTFSGVNLVFMHRVTARLVLPGPAVVGRPAGGPDDHPAYGRGGTAGGVDMVRGVPGRVRVLRVRGRRVGRVARRPTLVVGAPGLQPHDGSNHRVPGRRVGVGRRHRHRQPAPVRVGGDSSRHADGAPFRRRQPPATFAVLRSLRHAALGTYPSGTFWTGNNPVEGVTEVGLLVTAAVAVAAGAGAGRTAAADRPRRGPGPSSSPSARSQSSPPSSGHPCSARCEAPRHRQQPVQPRRFLIPLAAAVVSRSRSTASGIRHPWTRRVSPKKKRGVRHRAWSPGSCWSAVALLDRRGPSAVRAGRARVAATCAPLPSTCSSARR